MAKAVINKMVELERDDTVRKFKVVFETGYVLRDKVHDDIMCASNGAYLTSFVDDVTAHSECTLGFTTKGIYSGSLYFGNTIPYMLVTRFGNNGVDRIDIE
ncbi:hypothetical protein [Candidatus Methanoprimaticola sp. MG2]|uniref:hypothetical protein n=1 Tax=Candidatus Methanoprimaticola sp. MG2 TaxID=3228838 RepID=UPI0039C6A3E4